MGSSGFYEGLVCVKGVRVYKDLIAICMVKKGEGLGPRVRMLLIGLFVFYSGTVSRTL